MTRFRNGNPLVEDIEEINQKCLIGNRMLPTSIQIVTNLNKERDAVNAAVFDQVISENSPIDGSVLSWAIIVCMDQLKMKDGEGKWHTLTGNSEKRYFYQRCGEDD